MHHAAFSLVVQDDVSCWFSFGPFCNWSGLMGYVALDKEAEAGVGQDDAEEGHRVASAWRIASQREGRGSGVSAYV
jgi:hypothetical protein